MRQKFTVDDYSHYLFTPRDLTKWVMGLLRYDLTASQNNASSDHVLEVWAYEAHRLFRDRMVGQDNLNRFDNILLSVIRSDWGANVFESLESTYLSRKLCVERRYNIKKQYYSGVLNEGFWELSIQSILANPHTFVPQDIVRITESTGLWNQFAQEFWHLFPFCINFYADYWVKLDYRKLDLWEMTI